MLQEDVRAHECNIVVIDASLTPIQQRNLETALDVKVIDRTGLILEIFGLRALTKEGRLQVELARQLYERSRLVRTWTHLERQRGGRGFLGGPGETQLESDKRMIDRVITRLRRDLDAVIRTRDVQRSGRRRQGHPIIALIGYTNSGKSTLFNRLSGADVLAKDMPFATLDPTIRRLDLPDLGEASLIDTVGFITDLPTHLVDSFRATLEEVLDADLLIHVRDRSSNEDEQQKVDVLKVMDRLVANSGRDLPPIIEAWNKMDLLTQDPADDGDQLPMGSEDAVTYTPISALTGMAVDRLIQAIEDALGHGQQVYVINARLSDGGLRAWLYTNAVVESETVKDDTFIQYRATMSAKTGGQLSAAYPDVSVTLSD